MEALLKGSDGFGGGAGDRPWNPAAETEQGLAPGQRVGAGMRLGRYLLIDTLGAGGMGVVYRARDEKLERWVAVKVLKPGFLTSAAVRGRFRREALALARLNHPNIAALFDAGEEGEIDYLVMEWIPGQPLGEKLRNGPLPVAEATALLIQIAEALEEARAQGVVHRDLKPANVMITPRGHAKVLDFGVARLWRAGRDPVAVGSERADRDADVYVSGAGAGPGGGREDGFVEPGRFVLRDAVRPAAVPGGKRSVRAARDHVGSRSADSIGAGECTGGSRRGLWSGRWRRTQSGGTGRQRSCSAMQGTCQGRRMARGHRQSRDRQGCCGW